MSARKAILNPAAFLLALMILPASALAQAQPGKFDYYTLALSWSPSFCASKAGRNSARQCDKARRFAFVVHGLWPQFNRGWPQYCNKKPPYLQNRFIRTYYDIMPSKRLIINQWKKHGTCTGLVAEQYFSLTRSLFGSIKIPSRYLAPTKAILTTPQQLVEDFIKTNRSLTAKMISVQCGNNTRRARLREVRICFSRTGQLTDCGDNENRQCRARQLSLPPAR
jgi:ribonuclease T2